MTALIVEVLEEEEATVSGIVFRTRRRRSRSAAASSPSARAPGTSNGKRIEMDVADGDEVVFSKYGGTEIRLGTDES